MGLVMTNNIYLGSQIISIYLVLILIHFYILRLLAIKCGELELIRVETLVCWNDRRYCPSISFYKPLLFLRMIILVFEVTALNLIMKRTAQYIFITFSRDWFIHKFITVD